MQLLLSDPIKTPIVMLTIVSTCVHCFENELHNGFNQVEETSWLF